MLTLKHVSYGLVCSSPD